MIRLIESRRGDSFFKPWGLDQVPLGWVRWVGLRYHKQLSLNVRLQEVLEPRHPGAETVGLFGPEGRRQPFPAPR